MKIEIKRLTDTAKLPTRGSEYAAGYDLYADPSCGSYTISEGCSYTVSTGIAMAIPEGYFGAIYARSGIATKQGLRPANCVGVIDSDYRGEIKVCLHNDSSCYQELPAGTRVAQIVIQPCLDIEFDEVSSLDDTARGEGGFGSTGTD